MEAGRTIGIVGESGSGKSVEAMSILRLLDENGWIESGEILFDGQDITKVSVSILPPELSGSTTSSPSLTAARQARR